MNIPNTKTCRRQAFVFGALSWQIIPQIIVILIENQGAAEDFLDFARRADVVEVSMGMDERLHSHAVTFNHGQNFIGIVTGVDKHSLPCFRANQQ